jgi:urea transport system permease protein
VCSGKLFFVHNKGQVMRRRSLNMPGAIVRVCALLFLAASSAVAQPVSEPWDMAQVVKVWCSGDRDARIASFQSLLEDVVEADGPARQWAANLIVQYRDGNLSCAQDTGYIPAGDQFLDVVTGNLVEVIPDDAATPFLNIPLRRALSPFASAVQLVAAEAPENRLRAAQGLARTLGDVPPTLIERIYQQEQNNQVAAVLEGVLVPALLGSGDADAQLRAINTLAGNATRKSRATLDNFLAQEPAALSGPVRTAAESARSSVHWVIQVSEAMTVAYHGLSYGSVLFLAALGLAIIFGLMGVINLAQAEFVMLGSYATWFVQEALRALAPGLLEFYLFIAIPFAFLVPALVGAFMEWSIVRHVYTRPLLTLLATWAVSLLLINLVRVTVGTQNLSFLTPEYLKSGFTVFGEFSVTWSRLLSIFFAGITLIGTLFVLYRTRFGLRMRATTQHRQMAGCVGVSTRRTDAMAFAFGSGLAGIAGLALSTIYNVNPTMGTSLIIDSFIVVVLGGVGSVLGTALAALGIGQLNAIIEPLYGAVASKVIVLLAVILFIQQKPNGLFPRKGRR